MISLDINLNVAKKAGREVICIINQIHFTFYIHRSQTLLKK
ncbi:hypothetical protein FM106_14020 [Brachybacterium faecium]|nr:hypothetical protein FM106_14020 [Brachybacterium faecium]